MLSFFLEMNKMVLYKKNVVFFSLFFHFRKIKMSIVLFSKCAIGKDANAHQ